MIYLTKELNKDIELQEIYYAINSKEKRTLPVVFFDGHEGVDEADIYNIETKLNMSERERKFSFFIMPATFTFLTDYLEGEEYKAIYRPEKDFLSEFINRLRIITYLPEEIQKKVKDKRLLAMGYADYKARREISRYIKRKKANAYSLLEKCYKRSIFAADGLTIADQFSEVNYLDCVADLFEKTTIASVTKDGNKIYMHLEEQVKIVLSDVEILEEEVNPDKTFIEMFELHKFDGYHELHLLLRTLDENLMQYFHYVTYRFKDMYFDETFFKTHRRNFK